MANPLASAKSASDESPAAKPRGSAAPAEKAPRRRKTVVGTVRSTKMQKTITVDVIRLKRHPKYAKFIRRRTTYYAHDEKGTAAVGDQVRLEETRPLSRLKRWRLVEIVQRAKRSADDVASLSDIASSGGAT